MKNSPVFKVFVCSLLLVVGATPVAGAPPRSQASSNISKANNEFSISLMENLWKENANKNLFVSPANINLALAMLLNGCGGTTADEVAAVLGVDATDLGKLNQAYADWRCELLETDPAIELEIANAAFISTQHKVATDFAKALKLYDARTRQLDFVGDAEATKKVNQWCNAVTYGKIPELLQGVDKDTVVLLASAIYLKAEWQSPFDKLATEPEDFFFADGTKKLVATMYKDSKFEYLENADLQLIRLPYKGDDMAMYIVLPKPNVAIDALLTKLNRNRLASYIAQAQVEAVELHLPRISLSCGTSLNTVLEKMGMKKAFAPGADLSQMVDTTAAAVPQLSEVCHKTFLGIDEDGTEAAAVTGVSVAVSSIKPKSVSMMVNRPFALFICDRNTDTVIFSGVIVRP